MRNFRVVSFYTPKYEESAARLKESLGKHQIVWEIAALPDAGDWVKNCAMKPSFILNRWEVSSVPVVWLDADAVVQAYPEIFDRLEVDMAAHWRSDKRYWNELLSGTLFFNKTDGAKRILEAWVARCKQFEDEWDQRALEHVVHGMENISIFRLPASYTQIFDTMKDRGEPVIEHFQHSRSIKK